MVSAEDAINYLEQAYVIEPTFADPKTEDALQLIKDALELAHKALSMAEWEEEDGVQYCIYCGVNKLYDHYQNCPRQIALMAIKGH